MIKETKHLSVDKLKMAKKTKEPKMSGILKERRAHFMKHLFNEGFSLNEISWTFNNFPRATIYKIINDKKVEDSRS